MLTRVNTILNQLKLINIGIYSNRFRYNRSLERN